jgi:hypothetical protein
VNTRSLDAGVWHAPTIGTVIGVNNCP